MQGGAEQRAATLDGQSFKPLGRKYHDRRTVDLNQFVTLESSQYSCDGFARAANEMGQFLVGKRHGDAHLGLATGGGSSPIKKNGGCAGRRRPRQRQPPRVEKRGLILFGESLGCMKTCF